MSGAAIDEWMPAYQVHTEHAIHVAAPPAQVFATARATDLGRPLVVRALMGLRSLPALLRSGARPGPPPAAAPLDGFMRGRFTVLAERPGEEIVLGLQGRFWTATGGLVPVDRATFTDGPPHGIAQAAWNFRVTPERGGTRLTTETRVRFGDAASAREFARYWLVVKPFSGLIRRRMLLLIRRDAEAA